MKAYHVHSNSWPNARPLTTFNFKRKTSKLKYILWGVTAVLSGVSVGLLGSTMHEIKNVMPEIMESLTNVNEIVPEIMESLTNVDEIVPDIRDSVDVLQEVHEILKKLCATEQFKNVCNI